MSRSQAKVRFIIEEKVRFVDDSLSFRSKSIVFKQSSPSLSYSPLSSYPFPHFHIPTREEEWLQRRQEEAAAVTRERNAAASSATAGSATNNTAQSGNRKRKADPPATTASPPMTTSSASPAAGAPSPAPLASTAAATAATPDTGSTRRSSRVSARDLREEAMAAAAAAAAAQAAEREEQQQQQQQAEDEEEDEEGRGDSEDEEEEEGEEEEDDDAESGVSDLSSAKKRNSRLLSRSSHMSDEGGNNNAPTPVPEARLTSRQRALGGKGDDELLSIPNLPLKSKDASSLTEEQLARKAAANERRRISEKERMEKEKAETIQRLLNKKAPTSRKRGRKGATDGNDETLGEIPRAARIPRSRKGGEDDGGEAGEGEGEEDEDMVEGEEGDESESKGVVGAVETSRKWKYNCVLHRNFIEIDGGAKRTKVEDYATPLPATLKYSLSFPVSAPLPDSLFPPSANVSHLTEYYAQLLKSRRKEKPADDAEEEAEEEKKEATPADAVTSATSMEVDSGEVKPTTTDAAAVTDASAPTTSAAPPAYRMAPATRFTTCCSCSSSRKYSESLLALPVCSMECLNNVRKTTGYQKVAGLAQSKDKQVDDIMQSVLRSINSSNPTASQSLDELREEFRKHLYVLIHTESATTCLGSQNANVPHRLNSCTEASRYGIHETTAAQLEGSVVAMLQKYRTELLG